ncbi:MAG: pirin family protein [Ignavibacteriaceae bacterium]
MKKIIQKADERGIAEHGWLHSRFSFSFAEYYDPQKMGFGMLRVLNDDIIDPGEGFGKHPHNNMEIITIMLHGELEHKDSSGSGSVIKPGEIQVMSAGTGILHSEFNHSEFDYANLLQLWIIPKERNILPRYDQKVFQMEEINNGLLKVVSGTKSEDTLYIHQNAAISLGKLEVGKSLLYNFSYKGNGVYLFVIKGKINLDGEELNEKDAAGIYETENFEITTSTGSEFVLIEVPMN